MSSSIMKHHQGSSCIMKHHPRRKFKHFSSVFTLWLLSVKRLFLYMKRIKMTNCHLSVPHTIWLVILILFIYKNRSMKYNSTLPLKQNNNFSYMILNSKLSVINFFQKIIILFKLPGKLKENTYRAGLWVTNLT